MSESTAPYAPHGATLLGTEAVPSVTRETPLPERVARRSDDEFAARVEALASDRRYPLLLALLLRCPDVVDAALR